MLEIRTDINQLARSGVLVAWLNSRRVWGQGEGHEEPSRRTDGDSQATVLVDYTCRLSSAPASASKSRDWMELAWGIPAREACSLADPTFHIISVTVQSS